LNETSACGKCALGDKQQSHLNIPTGPPQTNWTRLVSERGLVKISVIETDTATSGFRWIFHMHSEFSRPKSNVSNLELNIFL
jgi:hypothetical protein